MARFAAGSERRAPDILTERPRHPNVDRIELDLTGQGDVHFSITIATAEAQKFFDSADLTNRIKEAFDIVNRNRPRLVSVSTLPDGPRVEQNPAHEEPIAQMETTVTNLPQHKGAFTEAMCGGVIYYTPDITNPHPVWREVFDDTTAAEVGNPAIPNDGGCDGGGWVQTSLDDKYLYHAVIGRSPGARDATDQDIGDVVAIERRQQTARIEHLRLTGHPPSCPRRSSSRVTPPAPATSPSCTSGSPNFASSPATMPAAHQYAQIAAIPGASQLVQAIFGAA